MSAEAEHRRWMLGNLSGRADGLVDAERVAAVVDRGVEAAIAAGFPGGDRRAALEWLVGMGTWGVEQ